MSQATFGLHGRNPDVLTCIANLSNDEVFTPPDLANQMLDAVEEAWAANNSGESIWKNSSLAYLDPFTKSGVFLREITKRLVSGLEEEIPDLGERVEHILTKQVFGIAITELTVLLARRSLYCSKSANGQHSIAESFTTQSGNVWFERTSHTWGENKCTFCGAPRLIFDRGEVLETHAYAFIHTDDIEARIGELFGEDMKFDVVIGNPPYQMTGGAGGSSDSSIYHLFVDQAKRLEPRFVAMVIPSRWLAGGRGLGEFRESMLTDHRLRVLVDYDNSREVFPNVDFEGGVCYFLWDHGHDGECEVTAIRGDDVVASRRQLDEFDIFVRDPRSAAILRKVQKFNETPITEILTADTPFGMATNFSEFHGTERRDDVPLHYVRQGKRLVGYIERKRVHKNAELIDT